jgi:hypothetical protein
MRVTGTETPGLTAGTQPPFVFDRQDTILSAAVTNISIQGQSLEKRAPSHQFKV